MFEHVKAIRAAAPLDPVANHVLLVIASHANDAGDAWPGVETIAAETGLSERSVQRAIARIEDARVLEVERRSGRSTRFAFKGCTTVTGDTLTGRPTVTGDTESQRGDSVTGRGDTESPRREHLRVLKDHPPRASNGAEPAPAEDDDRADTFSAALEVADTFSAALEVLAEREAAAQTERGNPPRSPNWAPKVIAERRHRHWRRAAELIGNYPGITPADLAEALEPRAPPSMTTAERIRSAEVDRLEGVLAGLRRADPPDADSIDEVMATLARVKGDG